MKINTWAVIVGIVVPIAALITILIICYVIRRRRLQGGAQGDYQQVQHTLDDEEIEFKRMLENRNEVDDMDDLFNEDDDISFDSKDRDRLQMLEKYRNNLVAGASSGGGDENDDLRL